MMHEEGLKRIFLTFVYFVLAFLGGFFVLTWKTTGITSWSHCLFWFWVSYRFGELGLQFSQTSRMNLLELGQ